MHGRVVSEPSQIQMEILGKDGEAEKALPYS